MSYGFFYKIFEQFPKTVSDSQILRFKNLQIANETQNHPFFIQLSRKNKNFKKKLWKSSWLNDALCEATVSERKQGPGRTAAGENVKVGGLIFGGEVTFWSRRNLHNKIQFICQLTRQVPARVIFYIQRSTRFRLCKVYLENMDSNEIQWFNNLNFTMGVLAQKGF